ncbi:MAG: type II toxin-antitoxin system RelE/ParE family toxin [Acidobacteria bacterium]|nr:type II toxin-antitoxin system RelE/ParE family toxin [Acidobacteriota bacterium]
MARKVIWAPRAADLLEEVARDIESDSPEAARKLVQEAMRTADSLDELSERGRIVPELHDSSYRELFIGKFRLVYRVHAEQVAVVAFVHGARDFRSWWKRFRRDRAPN